jgi:hypothetical protein
MTKIITINGKDTWRCTKVNSTPAHSMSSYFIHRILSCVVGFLTHEVMGRNFFADLGDWWLDQGNCLASVPYPPLMTKKITINGKDTWRCIKVSSTPAHSMSSYFIHSILSCVFGFLTHELMGRNFVADLRDWWLNQGNCLASVKNSLNQLEPPFGIFFMVTRYSWFLHVNFDLFSLFQICIYVKSIV